MGEIPGIVLSRGSWADGDARPKANSRNPRRLQLPTYFPSPPPSFLHLITTLILCGAAISPSLYTVSLSIFYSWPVNLHLLSSRYRNQTIICRRIGRLSRQVTYSENGCRRSSLSPCLGALSALCGYNRYVRKSFINYLSRCSKFGSAGRA